MILTTSKHPYCIGHHEEKCCRSLEMQSLQEGCCRWCLVTFNCPSPHMQGNRHSSQKIERGGCSGEINCLNMNMPMREGVRNLTNSSFTMRWDRQHRWFEERGISKRANVVKTLSKNHTNCSLPSQDSRRRTIINSITFLAFSDFFSHCHALLAFKSLKILSLSGEVLIIYLVSNSLLLYMLLNRYL